MWIFTEDGFFSIVRKQPGQHLTVRARRAADLDRLRQRWLPTLGPTIHGAGTDYPVRAVCDAHRLGEALLAMAEGIDYSNFKNRIATTLGKDHLHAAHAVWEALTTLEHGHEQPATLAPPDRPPGNQRAAYGGVVVDADGRRVLLREPQGHYGGYVWTFAKGGPRASEDGEACARREIREELGCTVGDMAPLPGWFTGDTTATRFYLCQWEADFGSPDPAETAQVQWVTWDEAATLIARTRSRRGRERDLAVLQAARRLLPTVSRSGATTPTTSDGNEDGKKDGKAAWKKKAP